MFELDEIPELRRRIKEQVDSDRAVLDQAIAAVQPLSSGVHTIKPRSATSVALMAADGGNNKVAFNPFYLQVVRVVDSNGRQLCLDIISPTTDTAELSQRQFQKDGYTPATALGTLMHALGLRSLHQLSKMIPLNEKSPSWVLVYRDLCEWATLFDLIMNSTFASDTLILRDGLLRSKIFAGDLFIRMHRMIQERIATIKREQRRNIWLVGLAKHTEVQEYYRLAMALAGVLDLGTPCFAPIPMGMQEKVYKWNEYIRDPDAHGGDGELPKYNAGSMHFVKFGRHSGDPVWTIDLLHHQANQAQQIFGYLLADAIAGFPVPFYPLSLQQADAHSRVADLDMDLVEDSLVQAIRESVGTDLALTIDRLRLATDVASRRYE